MNPTNYMNYRDIEYEESNLVNGMNGVGIKCKNYELCHEDVPLDHYRNHANYFCMTCGSWFKLSSFGWDDLEFKDCDEECIVCGENMNRKLKFPTNCGHWFCIPCSRNILFWDESRYHLNTEKYGCPPCSNGCINPDKGKQCNCKERWEIQDTWEQEHPEQFKLWNDAENVSVSNGETTSGSVYGSCKCPMCRKKYERT